jgi:hypothetical protein
MRRLYRLLSAIVVALLAVRVDVATSLCTFCLRAARLEVKYGIMELDLQRLFGLLCTAVLIG